MKSSKPITMGLIVKYETTIAAGLIIVCVFILSLFLLLPNILRVDAITKDKSILADKVMRLTAKKNTLSGINYESKKLEFEKMNHILPSSPDYVSIVETINNLELNTGVSIIKTDFKAPSKNLGVVTSPGFSFVWASFTLEGEVSQLENFLAGLNKLDGRLFQVYQTNYTQLSSSKSALDVVSVVYYNPVNLNLDTFDAVLPPLGDKRQQMIDSINQRQITSVESTESSVLGKIDLFN